MSAHGLSNQYTKLRYWPNPHSQESMANSLDNIQWGYYLRESTVAEVMHAWYRELRGGGKGNITNYQKRKMIHDEMQANLLQSARQLSQSNLDVRSLSWKTNTQSHLSFMLTIRQTNQFSTPKPCSSACQSAPHNAGIAHSRSPMR